MNTENTSPFKSWPGSNRPISRFTFTGRIRDICRAGCRNDYFHFHCPYKDFPFYNTPLHSQLVMSEKTTVRIESRRDRWRFVCPRGHRTWEPTNHHFWCQSCARAEGVDGVFHELRDRKTGCQHDREEVQLLTVAGPYDRELDREGPA